MLHVTVGVPIARGIWKKNELLGPEGIDRFVGQTVSSNGLILIRLFFCPIGRIKQEPWLASSVFKTMILSCHINKNILKLKKKKHLSFEPLETHIV